MYQLLTSLLLIAAPPDDVQSAFDNARAFHRMQQASKYPDDLKKATKPGQIFVLWIGYENPDLFAWCVKERSDAIHAFVKADAVHAQKGIVIGAKREAGVEPVRTFTTKELDSPKIREVILKSTTPEVVVRFPFGSPIAAQIVDIPATRTPTRSTPVGTTSTPTNVRNAKQLGGTSISRCVGFK